jgi:hypothetical protein
VLAVMSNKEKVRRLSSPPVEDDEEEEEVNCESFGLGCEECGGEERRPGEGGGWSLMERSKYERW